MMDEGLPRFILRELARYPDCEEGGKYIGFIERTESSTRIVVTDFLAGGPNAKRTRVEFLPDGDYQEKLFRQAEQINEGVEHLGSWHSHHCNGLGTFSEGDISGYFKTVNKSHYRPDFFIASLVTRVPHDASAGGWLHHFLFVKGDDRFYSISDRVLSVNRPTTFNAVTGHQEIATSARATRARDSERPDDVAMRHHDKRLSRPLDLPDHWYETEAGRLALSEDRRLFQKTFGACVKCTRVGGQVRLTGSTPSGLDLSVWYPVARDEDITEIYILRAGQKLISISCKTSERPIAIKGALYIQEQF
jgi:hypothetical protein